MAIEKQEITKKRSSLTKDELSFLVSPTFKSPCSYTDPIIINDEESTLEPKKKKRRLGSWWNYVDAINELSCVVKGSSKAKDNNKDDVARLDSCFSSTNLHEKKKDDKNSSLSPSDHDNFIDLSEDDDEIVGSKSNGHMTLEELGVTVEDLKSMPWELSLSDHDKFIDLSEDGDEIVGEGTCSSSSSNKGNGHVRLEELGVTVEDLKSMPWELFDPIWEIRSETMDPWLGGYVKEITSPGLLSSHA